MACLEWGDKQGLCRWYKVPLPGYANPPSDIVCLMLSAVGGLDARNETLRPIALTSEALTSPPVSPAAVTATERRPAERCGRCFETC